MSRVSRSLSWMMMLRNFCRSSTASPGLSCRISENARIDVSGVRSSCVTVETKSSFSRSSSFRRSLAARSSAVAAMTSRDFFSSSWLYAMTCDASSSIVRTSSIDSASSLTVDATMIRADAPPMAPASSVSANWTSPASAGISAGEA